MVSTQVRRVPRIIFVSDADPRTRHPRTDAAVSARVGWRVLAANNRPLGRSAQVFSSERECQDEVARLQKRLPDAVSSVLFDAARGHWTWTLLLDEVPVAVCVHPYLRRIECVRALAQFIVALESGDPELERVRNLGERALHAYDRPPARPSTAGSAQ
jgi:hypothetical protein